jgi:hypothetical protein
MPRTSPGRRHKEVATMPKLTQVTMGMVGLAAAFAVSGCGGDPPRVPFPTASSTPSVTAPVLTSPVAAGPATTFLCTTGAPLSVAVAPGGASLSYSYAGYPSRQMTLVPGGSSLYADGTYQLQLQGNQASIAYVGGQAFDTCARA